MTISFVNILFIVYPSAFIFEIHEWSILTVTSGHFGLHVSQTPPFVVCFKKNVHVDEIITGQQLQTTSTDNEEGVLMLENDVIS